MKFLPNHLYHVYNQGNNRTPIFFNRDNYLYFLEKVNRHISPYCHIMAWCLMPNHFHFLLGTDHHSVEMRQIGNILQTNLSNGFRVLESSFAKGINRQQGRSGSLFRQHTQCKCLTEEAFDFSIDPFALAPDFLNPHPLVCFHYIHQNPEKAGLVKVAADWEFSSLRDHLRLRNGKLCNFDLARRWVGLTQADFDPARPIILDAQKVSFLFNN